MADVVADRYELEELIGRGGMSSVFRAHDRLLERKVALKILHPEFTADEDYVERFRREARSAAQLSHPNIVTVIDRGEQDGRQFIVFEYVGGETLKQLVDRTGPLRVRDALTVALQVARALGFAHEQGVVHRDVKPQNVLLDGDGRAKVTDFGIARSLDVTSVTQTGTVLGTSDYIAPEQASGERVDDHTDIYSFGVVLFELLTGEIPFPADNFVAAALRHVNDPPPSMLERRPDIPLRLVRAVDRMLAKDPAERFASMDAVVAELEGCLADLGDESADDVTMLIRAPAAPLPRAAQRRRGPERRPRAQRLRRAAPLLLSILGVLLLGAATVGAVALVRDGDDGGAGGSEGPRPVRLTGVGSYDPPPGDGQEHDAEAVNAADGNPATSWSTEAYQSFSDTKPGVGLVLDAGRRTALGKLTIRSESGGFTARVRVGESPGGPFRFRSAERTVTAPATTVELYDGTRARYVVVWITALESDRAQINEVRAQTS